MSTGSFHTSTKQRHVLLLSSEKGKGKSKEERKKEGDNEREWMGNEGIVFIF